MITLNEIHEELRRRVVGADSDLILRFAGLFFAAAGPEFYRDRDAATLASLVLSAFRHLQESEPQRVDITVTQPEDEAEPWTAPVTVIRTHVSERPFVVTTIREFLYGCDLEVERFLHPVLKVKRAADGSVIDVGPAEPGVPLESIVHCEITRVSSDSVLAEVRDGIRRNLEHAVVVTNDFEPMVHALNDTIDSLDLVGKRLTGRTAEVEEVRDFLRWLRPNFVFLGYDEWGQIDRPLKPLSPVEQRTAYGLARADVDVPGGPVLPPAPDSISENAPAPRWPARLLTVTQTPVESTVHRRVRMHCVSVRGMDEQNRVVGERRFIGLFRSRAYAEDAEHIPILRNKLRIVMEQSGFMEGSHDQREAVKIFNTMPKEELFQATSLEIGEEIKAILAQYYTHDVRATIRHDAEGRSLSIMVIMPRDRYSGRVRRALQGELVRRLDGTLLNYNLVMGGGEQARLHFQVAAPEQRLAEVTPEQVENIVHELVQTWGDQLERRLVRLFPPEDARRIADRWSTAFSPEYQASTTPDEGVIDLSRIEDMEAIDRKVDIRLANRAESYNGAEPFTRLIVYIRGEQLVLSDFMPILENVGLRVLTLSPFDATDEQGGAHIYVFSVQDEQQQPLDLGARSDLLTATILAVAAGEATNDGLNGLVLSAGLNWRQVDMLRAYAEYAFQLQVVPSRQMLLRALRAHPEQARLLVRLFMHRFDPSVAATMKDRMEGIAKVRTEFLDSLASVSSLSDDRALRRLLALIDATARTNYYVHGGDNPTRRSGGAPYISFKIMNELLQTLVPSRLRSEVWVHSPRMAGIHMRGAKVARGGLRYSDRPDDLRTEVLGLVRTQSVKNAVIVPAGSKGGFITRELPKDPELVPQEVAEQYRTFIRGLLDLTDNLVDGEVVRNPALIALDEPDPYLVVAADKGTATFSDVANAVAKEYDFWLDDAFASGGSNGYDHKRVGITARGAWECVKRHFRELGRDTQTQPLTVVGIGDMSGDVFGNGMLLSRQIRLIAAFDHRHIFVDPDPDAEKSYQERERLFRKGRSNWAEYDPSLLSDGGFVVPRGLKEITLTPQARDALGVPEGAETMDGETLIRTILSAPVDLLWNGGIGTYVKAPNERHADVGDPANDAVRVDATQLRCRVLGEGGNLGLTQQARVCFALNGGACNTDAIDNSGGVEMSDREVNLKILLNGATAAGTLNMESRNELLLELTGAVTEKVLADNRSQSLAISLDMLRAGESYQDFHGAMLSLEQRQALDRANEVLPTLEVLVERQTRGQSLARPELAVLLAYTKLTLKQDLLASSVPDDPAMDRYLTGYFPDRAVEVVGAAPLAGHRLRREIIATQLGNDMVDIMGVTFLHRMSRDTGRPQSEIARAWFIASSIAGAAELRERLAGLEGEVSSQVVYRWLLGLSRVLERTTRWILANVSDDVSIGDVIGRHLNGITELRANFTSMVRGEEQKLYEDLTREASQLSGHDGFGASLITLRFLDQLLGILKVANETGVDAMRVGRGYYLVAELLDLPALRRAVADAASGGRWEHRAAQTLVEEIARVHRQLTATVVANTGNTAEKVVQDIAARRKAEIETYRTVLGEALSDDRPTLAGVMVAVRELETVIDMA